MQPLCVEPSQPRFQHAEMLPPDAGAEESPSLVGAETLSLPLDDQNGAVLRVKPDPLTGKLGASLIGVVHNIAFLYRLLRHTNTPWHAKGLLFLPLMYLCSPIQLIPNFIPIIGQMDDLFVIWIAKTFARKLVDKKTWQECDDAAAAMMLTFSRYLAGIKTRQTK
jgi:uncharacterized membrane protein YkvA (DUF1232 family)